MKLPEPKPTPTTPKAKSVNVRVSEAQAVALKRHTVRTGQSTSEIILAALATAVPDWPA